MSEITVPVQATEVEYLITTSDDGPFAVPFSFFEQSDIRVIARDDATNIETELVNPDDWTFTSLVVPVGQEGIGYQSAEITLDSPLVTHSLKIFRDTTIHRITNYPSTGPFNIWLLNNELARAIAIMQELEAQKELYLSLPDGSLDTTPYDASGRAICNVGESADDACLATNRQVDANGPNWLQDTDLEAAVGTENQWNTIVTGSAIKIEGQEPERIFDLMTQFFSFMQNRGGAEAQFYVRYRYQVDCYSEVAKVANVTYPVKIPANSAMPFNFMDIVQDIEYLNGNCTLTVGIDVYPLGANSGSLFLQWKNLAVTTSEPR